MQCCHDSNDPIYKQPVIASWFVQHTKSCESTPLARHCHHDGRGRGAPRAAGGTRAGTASVGPTGVRGGGSSCTLMAATSASRLATSTTAPGTAAPRSPTPAGSATSAVAFPCQASACRGGSTHATGSTGALDSTPASWLVASSSERGSPGEKGPPCAPVPLHPPAKPGQPAPGGMSHRGSSYGGWAFSQGWWADCTCWLWTAARDVIPAFEKEKRHTGMSQKYPSAAKHVALISYHRSNQRLPCTVMPPRV